MEGFQRLFEPGEIGGLSLKNRYVMPAMVTNMATFNGEVSERQLHYYAERAKGGVGLIIVEMTKAEYHLEFWDPHSTLRIDTMKHMTLFNELTDVIHLHGAKVALQLTPGKGSWVTPKELWIPGFQTIGPTTFACPGAVAHALTTEETEQLVQAYGEAALRAKKAGFDALEIHGHSSYLLGQFMSPYVNNRTDKYGVLWQLPVELLRSVKDTAGATFPVILRISGDEFIASGRTIDGTIEIIKHMEAAGVDAIDVSNGTYYQPEGNRVAPYMTLPRCTFVPQAAAIKKAVKIPVIVPGKLADPNDAERVLREGIADFIAVGRGLIADPELPRKVNEKREADIRPCIYCNECVEIGLTSGHGIGCSVNAQAGKEREYQIQASTRPKKVLIIGGGPGGMEAARVAALRGHKVTLCEKEARLGGHFIPAATPELKKDLRSLLEWLSSQLKKLGVNIMLRKEMTRDMVMEIKPDVAIVAVGATPLIPEIPGVRQPIVATAVDVLLGNATAGHEVIVAGGGSVGCDVAALLADEGKKVTVVEMLAGIALDMPEMGERRAQLLVALEPKNITWLTNTRLVEITGGGIIAEDKDGTRHDIRADTVVLALGFTPRAELYEALKGKVPELYAIGDCVEPRKIWDAIHEGFFRANSI